MTEESEKHGSDPFPATRWTLVRKIASDNSVAERALDELCQQYWRPVYIVIRSRTASLHDAEDLTQEYFSSLLRRGYYRDADQTKGKFRAFLMTDLLLFLSSSRAKQNAQKRGGGKEIISLDAAALEDRILDQSSKSEAPPELLFDREWALDVVRQAMEMLRQSYERKGTLPVFDHLKTGLNREVTDRDYAEWSVKLGSRPESLRVALFRLREKLRDNLKQLVRETVSTEADFKEEMRYLRQVLQQPDMNGM
jgi:DNA-directed RNA polymerase specialized sigma24 family protein